ncbi:MAG: hypothetical protein RLZZ196_2477 [Bacteroidota bacterium]|jgi:hypothetical protein
MLKPFFVSCLLWCLSTSTLFAQTSPASDSTTIRWEGKWSTPKERFQPIPKKAILYSAILPGLGQVYNRQYWKVPIIYAGMAAAFIAYDFNNSRYQQYKKAYIARIDNNPSTTDEFVGLYTDANLKTLQDSYKRFADMTILFTAVGFAIQSLDALTAAHLKNFDVSKDISFRFSPTVLPSGQIGIAMIFKTH